ncbi:hypothetical protein CSC70_04200 [Pseudoxanthomonas kalamensis DSM 18571]|uniref:luciferase domain-containing protein n=1 Tax=Pseudoxanthomonas kalamensis TaxID=289483 RepID=UPI0013908127|nr:luciferase family protein [Pseudoxanthomonas kalamensis]KAF1711134.1 hypothetical protein CSC70_04200 [Pseudoxanthomonas kalamensis DSM 18571]
MHALRKRLSRKLREIGVEEQAWPGRDDGFASLMYGGKEFAHFHSECELDIRLGKDVIKRERLSRLPDSTVHPDRSASSPWHEMRILADADVDEAVRLVRMAVERIGSGK